jgi:hypothetical protein
VVPGAVVPATWAVAQRWRPWHTLASLSIVGAIIGLSIWASTSMTLITDLNGHVPLWTFLGLAALLAAFAALVGWAITGLPMGALVDPKKGRMSLSRLQMLCWTILILAAYLNAFIVNIAAGRADPVAVAIPGELLVAMGISITGLAGAQLVLGYKQNEHGTAVPTANGTTLVLRDDGTDASGASVRSAIARTDRPSWRDIFMGDTAERVNSLDLGKVQLFYITVVLILGYGIFVANSFVGVKTGTAGGIGSLPALDEAFVALLALSHGGYLTTKAAA